MKYIFLFFYLNIYSQIVLSSNYAELPQKIDLLIKVDYKSFKINTSLNFLSPNDSICTWEAKLINDNSLILKLQLKNGNENVIIENLFLKENNDFKLNYCFRLNSNRNEMIYEAKIISNINLENFSMNENIYFENYDLILIHQNKLQEFGKQENLLDNINELFKINYVNKNLTNLKLLSNSLFIKEKYILNKYTLDYINNIAYYLEQANNLEESNYLLEQITTKFPNRIVSWLNIADVNWKLKKYEQAKKQYLQYITLMKSEKKDLKKIPKHVFDRVK